MVNNGRKVFTILLIITIAVTLVLGGYIAYDYISTYINSKEAAEAVDEFENSLGVMTIALEDDVKQNNVVEQQETEEEDEPEEPVRRTSTTTYKGYDIIGTIQIPRTNVKYPIVAETTPDAMDKAIVLLYGPGLNEIGNTIIAGHNYRNGGFFGNNKKLEEGDLIYITDETGNKVEYEIYRKYETEDYDFSYATRETNGKREISLSTCTNDASIRLIIWAVET